MKCHSFLAHFLRRAFLAVCLSPLAIQTVNAFDLTVSQTPGGPGKAYTLTWTAVDKATDTSNITYYIFEEFGSDAVGFDTNNPTAHPNFRRSVIDLTSARVDSLSGTRGFLVVSSDSFNGQTQVSNTVYHNFIHLSQSNDGGGSFGRTDGDGTHRGVDQIWKFTYFMDDDALVTMRVFPPGTTFGTDANGFITSASNEWTKTLVDRTPRSGELASGSVAASNGDDQWDSRNSTGAVMGNGIYYVLIQARLDAGQSGYSEGELRQGSAWTVPVDILRIIGLTATGITLTNSTSQIGYTLTGDALVRIVIAQPGSGFIVDANGNIQAANRTAPFAQNDALIVSTFSFQRKAGSNTETWDGISSSGTVMPSGVYAVGISATDEYGNKAISVAGDDFPIFTTLTLERSAGSSGGTTTTADTTAPTVSNVTINNNTAAVGSTSQSLGTVTSSISTITIQMADNTGGAGINVAGSAVTLTGPSGAITPSSRVNGADTITLYFSSAVAATGSYTLRVIPIDLASNSQTYNFTFGLSVQLSAGTFDSDLRVFPNPAKNQNVTISYNLSVASDVKLEIFNILGERVYTASASQSAGTGVQFPNGWNLRNTAGARVGSGLYLMRVTATGGGNSVEAVKKVVVVQ